MSKTGYTLKNICIFAAGSPTFGSISLFVLLFFCPYYLKNMSFCPYYLKKMLKQNTFLQKHL